MSTLLLTLGASFTASLSLVPAAAWLARRVHLLDAPDGRRKIQPGPVPLAGGIAIFAAVGSTLTAAWLISADAAEWFRSSALPLPGLLAAAVILCLVGVADDRFVLGGRLKLVGQTLAVAVFIFAGGPVRSLDLFGWSVQLGLLAVPFTAFWLLGAINSLNLIDGMDGMVGCVGAIIAAVIAVMGLWSGQLATALVALALTGAIVGFLCFNLPPARVYLGDCGSMLIGLFVGVLALHGALKGPATVMLTIPSALLAIPILDTSAAVARRTLTGRSIYATDRGHLHHCLLRSGMSGRRVLLVVSGLCLLTGAGALASLALHRQFLAAASAVAVAAILTVTRWFGRTELLLFKTRLSYSLLWLRHVRHPDRIIEVFVHLQGSANWDSTWRVLTEAAEQFQLSSLCLDANIPSLQESFHARWGRSKLPPEGTQSWHFGCSLIYRGQPIGHLDFQSICDRVPASETVAVFEKIVEDLVQAVTLLADQRNPRSAFRPERAVVVARRVAQTV